MNCRHLVAWPAIAALSIILSSGTVVAQQKPLALQLVGSWTPVVIENVRPDGSRAYPYSSTPKGILIFTGDGHFSLHVLKPGIPHYASNNRSQGTAEENKATVQGGIHFFGTYTVHTSDDSFTLHIAGSSFPNYNGFDQTRKVSISGDEMKLALATVSAGGGANQVWKRLK